MLGAPVTDAMLGFQNLSRAWPCPASPTDAPTEMGMCCPTSNSPSRQGKGDTRRHSGGKAEQGSGLREGAGAWAHAEERGSDLWDKLDTAKGQSRNSGASAQACTSYASLSNKS